MVHTVVTVHMNVHMQWWDGRDPAPAPALLCSTLVPTLVNSFLPSTGLAAGCSGHTYLHHNTEDEVMYSWRSYQLSFWPLTVIMWTYLQM